ncbi:hypothetical protein DKT68_13370 [Micromonospora acroterricola]|uniref:Uncharacterized protein n=1 Tax=Micromonospora acroterricola TaxID=2202421 RepID=A0A317D325_9ACTN|nr:hypothetical protein DKT68_13370 [Micromonospora acroterricola]
MLTLAAISTGTWEDSTRWHGKSNHSGEAAVDDRHAPISARSGTPIRLTLPEIRRLLNTLMFTPAPNIEHALHWSAWRRIHQAVARQAHYQRRLTLSAT